MVLARVRRRGWYDVGPYIPVKRPTIKRYAASSGKPFALKERRVNNDHMLIDTGITMCGLYFVRKSTPGIMDLSTDKLAEYVIPD